MVLQNARHELFAQNWATGMSREAAYKAAGYKPDRGAASRLSANINIKARVRELKSRAATDVVVSVSMHASWLLVRLAPDYLRST